MVFADVLLESLGAERQRDGSYRLDLGALQLTSVFGGQLQGTAGVRVRGEELEFVTPPELAVCDPVALPTVDDGDGLRAAIAEVHGALRAQAHAHLAALRRLGFQPSVTAPVPRARASVPAGGTAANVFVTVGISEHGNLLVEAIGGVDVPAGIGTLAPVVVLSAADARRRIDAAVAAFDAHTFTNGRDNLSKEDLAELKHALDDEDDDDDDDFVGFSTNPQDAFRHLEEEDDEPTAVGVTPPQVPASRLPQPAAAPAAPKKDEAVLRFAPTPEAPFDLWGHPGTGPMVVTAGPPTEERVVVGTLDEVRREEAAAAAALASLTAGAGPGPTPVIVARNNDLLDEFDDDDEATYSHGGGADDASEIEDFSLLDDEFDDNDNNKDEQEEEEEEEQDEEEYVHVRAASEVPPALDVPPHAATPDDDRREHLVASLLAGSPAAAVPVSPWAESEDLLAALAADGGAFINAAFDGPAAVSAADTPSGRPPSAGPDARWVPPAPAPNPDIDAVADGFDDGAGSPLRQPSLRTAGAPAGLPAGSPPGAPPGPPAAGWSYGVTSPGHADHESDLSDEDEDFDGSKTRALAVDAALLDRLRREDPAAAPDSLEDSIAGLSVPAGPIPSPARSPAALTSALGAIPALSEAFGSGGISADGDADAAENDGSLKTKVGDGAVGSSVFAVPPPIDPVSGEQGDVPDDELAALMLRAAALRAELAEVESQIAARQTARESTTTRRTPSLARHERRPAPTEHAIASVLPPPPVITAEGGAWAAVGASADDEGLDAATVPLALQGPLASRPPVLEPRAPVVEDEAGVSLADLQGALREIGVEVEHRIAHRNGAHLDGREHGDAEDDVFGSDDGSEHDDSKDPEFEDDGSEDDGSNDDGPTNVRPRGATVALVVEDARARERLKAALVSRYGALFEAEDARAATALEHFHSIDALVFVRPSQSEPNRIGFDKLGRMARRPRVLVLSGDLAFDGLPAVDRRLPLGQKASEVARQVLDGLEELGVAAVAE
jgi:hypothetical protein